jgi:APA family basic amino acid/polyamine antiporter
VADAAEVVLGPFGKPVLIAIAIISLLSINNAGMMVAPRIIFAMSRDRLFISRGAEVNDGGTPAFALSITVAVTVFLIMIGRFETLLAMSAFMYVSGYLAGFISLIVLRRREPDLPRPFRTPFYPWPTVILLVGSTAFLIGAAIEDTANAIYALGFIALTYPAYLLLKRLLPSAQ